MWELTNAPEKHNETKTRETYTLFDNSLLSNVIDVLFDAKDLSYTINLILSLLGRYYNLDSIGICEYTSDCKYIINTYQWRSQGSKDFTDSLYQVDIEDSNLYAYYKTYKTGVYYCRDIHDLDCKYSAFIESLKTQNIQSFLQCATVHSSNYNMLILRNIPDN